MKLLIRVVTLLASGLFTPAIVLAGPTPTEQCEHPLDSPQTVMSTGWSNDLGQSRHVEAGQAGMTGADLDDLTLKWSFVYADTTNPRSVPALTNQAIVVGSQEGSVFALDRETGCSFWRFQAGAEVRTGLGIATVDGRQLVFFGDLAGYAYAIDARDGTEVWRSLMDEHPEARITGSPVYHNGVLYVPVSSYEVARAVNPLYRCCTFRGSVHAVDARTGATLWKTYTIAEEAQKTGRNLLLVRRFGPSGVAVWSSPTIDEKRGLLYVGTGQNYSSPATGDSDAILALELATGNIVWRRQTYAGDAWNAACVAGFLGFNCPREKGPDFDFGAPPILVQGRDGKDYLVAGQKSGMVYAMDPDNGDLIWSTRVGRGGVLGGIHWGMAADDAAVYVPVADVDLFVSKVEGEPNPSLAKLELTSGEILWQSPVDFDCEDIKKCYDGLSAAITLIEGAVLAPGLDGVLYAYDTDNGEVIWSYNSRRDFEGINGLSGSGGSLEAGGVIVADGLLMFNSGYGGLMMPGNVLLVFGRP